MCVPVIRSHDLYEGVDGRGVGGLGLGLWGTGPLISVNGAVKHSKRFGLRPLYPCCLFCFRRLNMEQRRCEVNGGSLFYFSIHSHCVNNYKNFILDFFYDLLLHTFDFGTWQQYCYCTIKLLSGWPEEGTITQCMSCIKIISRWAGPKETCCYLGLMLNLDS